MIYSRTLMHSSKEQRHFGFSLYRFVEKENKLRNKIIFWLRFICLQIRVGCQFSKDLMYRVDIPDGYLCTNLTLKGCRGAESIHAFEMIYIPRWNKK